jgi:hypothetical protein
MSTPRTRGLSKSRFCSGLQCLKQLWWRAHEPDAPELRAPASLQAVFDRGHRVGELAQSEFPGGVLIDREYVEVPEKIADTTAALQAKAPAIYEASFDGGGVFVAVDILERLDRGHALVEVKATLSVKEQFIPDVAVQLYAARAAGLDVRRAELMHLNRACAFPDLKDLFVREDVTAATEALQPSIPRQLGEMRAALDGPLPNVAPGAHCDEPYGCPFVGRCHPALPEHHVSTLYRIEPEQLAEFAGKGWETIADLPDDVALLPAAARQVRSVKSGKVVVEAGLAEALAAIEAPVAYLDFESVNPPVPAWQGCHPYQHVPVQMSCHVVGPSGGIEHVEHLAEAGGDPRPPLAAAVVRACESARTVVAYHARFERACLEHLAEAVPEHRRALLAIRDRLVDLLPIVREHVYHPGFGGNFGLKAVLPALVPGAGYGDLAIADGNTASAVLEGLLLSPEATPAEDRERLRRELLAYCERDTLAMVKLTEQLGVLASQRERGAA